MSILDRFKLDGKVAVVTGASSGLGVAFSKALAEAGADLVLGARREERLADTGALVTAAGRTWVGRKTDVTKPEDCAALIALAIEKYGHVDILVNNAGVGTAVPATHETPDQYRSVIETNLMGSYWMAQEFAKANKGGGAIVNISSVLGLKPQGLPQAAYASSKAGLIGFTKSIAAELGSRNIRCNAIAPGFIETEMTEVLDPAVVEQWRNAIPLKRGGKPEDVANATVFLASDMSAYITGQTLHVCGGMLM